MALGLPSLVRWRRSTSWHDVEVATEKGEASRAAVVVARWLAVAMAARVRWAERNGEGESGGALEGEAESGDGWGSYKAPS